MKKVIFLIACFYSLNVFSVGEPSTFFQVFVPPNNDWVGRDVSLIVTAIYDSTSFTIVDDDMDGDDDDSFSGMLMAGQSYILYLREGGINDDAPHPGESTTKQDGDYFIISSSNLVFVSQSTNSDWQHDWVPATNKSSRGQKFILYSPPTSYSNRDVNVFAYEDNTEVTITQVSYAPQTTSGYTNVNLSDGTVVVQKTIDIGEDLIFNYTDGRDLLENGHTYVIEASKGVTAQYGALWNNARDGGGYVPSSNGTSSGELFYFTVPYQSSREQEIRIVSWDDGNNVQLDRYSGGTWVSVYSESLEALGSGDWVSYAGNHDEVFRLTCTSGKKVSVFEANWLETGSPGTSDVASMVSSREGNTSGREFLCYMSPPGSENRVRDPFTGLLFSRASHLYIFSRKNATVTVKDAYTNGGVINRSFSIAANEYVDCYLTLAEWKSIYNGTGTPSGLERPYLLVESDVNISVFNTNFNDNWMAYFGSSLEQSFGVNNVNDELQAPSGDIVVVIAELEIVDNSTLENVTVEVIVGDGATPISSTLIDQTTSETFAGESVLNESTSQSIINFEGEPNLDPTHEYQIETALTLNHLDNTNEVIADNTVISVETIITGEVDGTVQQAATSQGVIVETADQSLLSYETYSGTDLEVSSDSWAVSWGDYDNDCDPDLFITERDVTKNNRLYRNNGDGTFTRITTAAPVATNDVSTSASWGDYDNDGDLDLFVANNLGYNNSLFTNNGDGSFSIVTNDQIVADKGYTHSANWVDVNNDGYLDMFTTDYFPTRFNHLYINDGDGTFSENRSAQISSEASFSVSSAWVDYDLDGDVDVFVVNNEGKNNSLYRNEGNGEFTKITSGSIVNDGGHSVGASWGDFNDDLYPDLFVANSSNENDFLYENNGDGTFTRTAGFEPTLVGGNSHGSAWIDTDNDSDLDLFVTDDQGLNRLYLSSSSATELVQVDPLQLPLTGSGLNSLGTAWADYDLDGDIDAYVTNHSGQQDAFYLNNSTSGRSVTLTLTTQEGSYGAIGARVKFKVNSTFSWETRFVQSLSGGGTGGQNDMRITLGVGDATSIDSLVIYWPSGQEQVITDVDATATNKNCIQITEPETATLCGTVYYDINENCIAEGVEGKVFNQTVQIDEINRTAKTDRNGFFSFHVPVGTYTLSWSEDNVMELQDGCLENYTVVVNSTSENQCDNDFSVAPLCLSADLELEITHTESVIGLETMYLFKIENNGVTEASQNEITIDFGGDLVPLQSSGWASTVGNLYTWELDDVEPGGVTSLIVEATLSNLLSLGADVGLSGTISTLSLECNSVNNTETVASEAVGSVDPNDIQVSPSFFFHENEVLTYKIRFQNVGNYPARDVLLIDSLPEELDFENILVKNASHSYQLETNNGVLKVYFDDINLVDSLADEPNSHGFITFSIPSYPGSEFNEVIENRAYIQFDRNPFIVTNSVFNLKVSLDDRELTVFPNPVTEKYIIVMARLDEDDAISKLIQIRDVYGNLVREFQAGNIGDGMKINLLGVKAGFYSLVYVEDGRVEGSVKLVVE